MATAEKGREGDCRKNSPPHAVSYEVAYVTKLTKKSPAGMKKAIKEKGHSRVKVTSALKSSSSSPRPGHYRGGFSRQDWSMVFHEVKRPLGGPE